MVSENARQPSLKFQNSSSFSHQRMDSVLAKNVTASHNLINKLTLHNDNSCPVVSELSRKSKEVQFWICAPSPPPVQRLRKIWRTGWIEVNWPHVFVMHLIIQEILPSIDVEGRTFYWPVFRFGLCMCRISCCSTNMASCYWAFVRFERRKLFPHSLLHSLEFGGRSRDSKKGN